MFRRLMKRMARWYRNNQNYRLSRRISDFRACSTAERLICTGALQSTRLTGAPLAKDCK